MKTWQDFGFEIEITKDGSPTLHLIETLDSSYRPHGESMHHSVGAAAETLFIYGKPAHETLKAQKQGDFLVVGLGMGYIEATLAREGLLLNVPPENISIVSYESVLELKTCFLSWLYETDEISANMSAVYDQMVLSLVRDTVLTLEQVKGYLRSLKMFKILGEILPDYKSDMLFDGIFYDAFSAKTTPFLWEEEFLINFFKTSTKPKSFISTYSYRAELRKALKACGFDVVPRDALAGKRKSTLGLRNV